MSANTPKKTVLVVDDEEALCEIISGELADAGYEVLCAPNGNIAFEIIKQQPIDLVISDLRMPHGDGISLLKDIKTHHLTKPVVLLMTGYADITIEQAYDAGAEALFLKPLNFHRLLRKVAEFLKPIEERLSRNFARHQIALKVEILYPGAAERKEVTTLNIGRGGFFLVMEEKQLEPGQKVEFVIRFESGEYGPISGIGVVRWRRTEKSSLPRGIGVEFCQLDDQSLQILIRFLDSIRTKTYIPIR
jgi:CheY-like chemotaxis protein